MPDESIEVRVVYRDGRIGEGNAPFFHPGQKPDDPIAFAGPKFRHVELRHVLVDIQNDLCAEDLCCCGHKDQIVWKRVNMNHVITFSELLAQNHKKRKAEEEKMLCQVETEIRTSIFIDRIRKQSHAINDARISMLLLSEANTIHFIAASNQCFRLSAGSCVMKIDVERDHTDPSHHVLRVFSRSWRNAGMASAICCNSAGSVFRSILR